MVGVRRLLGSLVRLAVFAALVGLVVSALVPGGPIGLPRLGDQVDAPQPDARETAVGTGPVATEEAPPGRPLGESPWEDEVLTVAVRNRADPSRDVDGAVAEAIGYWNRNAGYADYPATLRLVPDAEDPDVVVWYNATIECPHHADAIGCAPLIEEGSRVDRPVGVQVRYDPADNRRQVRNTVIHELGHVLGITHCEPPYWVMASACDEPVPDAPDAADRALAWRDPTVSVYVDDRNVSDRERALTRDQVGHAVDYLQNGSAPGFPDVRFVRADDPYDADVTVTFLAGPDCPERSVVCSRRHGRDFDRDGRMEYYTNVHVALTPEVDVEARGWYVGRWLALHVSPSNVPPVLEDASYRERRSDWWE